MSGRCGGAARGAYVGGIAHLGAVIEGGRSGDHPRNSKLVALLLTMP